MNAMKIPIEESSSSAMPRPARQVLVIDARPARIESLDKLGREIGFTPVYAESRGIDFDNIPTGQYPVIMAELGSETVPEMLPRLARIDRAATWLLFTDGDLESLKNLPGIGSSVVLLGRDLAAHDLGAILRSTLLEREASDENFRLKSLLFGLKKVNAEPDFNRRLDQIMSLAMELSGGNSGSLMLLDPVGQRLTIAAAKNLSFPKLASVAVPVGENICGYVAQSGYGLLINPQLKSHPFFGRFMHRDEIGSAMSVPLMTQNRLLGVLNLNRKREPFFSAKDLEMASLMAETVTLYIEDLFDQARTQKSFQDRERAHVVAELASALSHELRNPMTAMVGYAELMVDAVDRSKRQSHLKKVLVNSGRIHKLIDDLKLLYHGSQTAPTTFNINLVLEDCINFVAFQNPTNRISLETDLDPGLPPLTGEERDLMQVFVNLLNNAYQVIPDVGSILVKSRREGSDVVVTIRDNGPGVEPDNLPRIFSPFFTTRKKHGGTGMGLAIVKAIVDRCGGQISVESSPGKGATFITRLPLQTTIRN